MNKEDKKWANFTLFQYNGEDPTETAEPEPETVKCFYCQSEIPEDSEDYIIEDDEKTCKNCLNTNEKVTCVCEERYDFYDPKWQIKGNKIECVECLTKKLLKK